MVGSRLLAVAVLGASSVVVSMTPCVADLNDDNIVDTSDLGILTGQYGSQCPCSADINGDGVVDTADLGILIGVFGESCDGCGESTGGDPESMMAGPGAAPPNPLLSELGFEDVSSYRTWLGTLSPAEVEQHLSDCLSILQSAE